MEQEKKKTGAPLGNTNARKGAEPRTASVVMKVEPSTKKRWVDHAKSTGFTLVDTVSDAVEAKIKKDKRNEKQQNLR